MDKLIRTGASGLPPSASVFRNRTLVKEDRKLAQPNYQYEKRQKDLAKKKKKEEKLQQRKALKEGTPPAENGEPAPAVSDAKPE